MQQESQDTEVSRGSRYNFLKKKSLWVLMAVLLVVLVILTIIILFYVLKTPYIGAVVSNVRGCASIGTGMLKNGGSAVDAAIGTLICEGVQMSHLLGIGGGFSAIVYTKSNQKMESLIAREKAPAAAHKDLLVGHTARTGAILAAVPGEVLGYWELHQRYGRLPWRKLFEPTIELSRNGHEISKHLRRALLKTENDLRLQPELFKFLSTDNGELKKYGDHIKHLVLAETLERIAENGPAEIYGGGKTGQLLVEDIQKMGGIITLEDLKDYSVMWHDSDYIKANISGGYTLYTTPLPTSGAVLVFISNVMHNFSTINILAYFHYMVESFKHAYAQRGKLGDMYNDPKMESSINRTFRNLLDPKFAKHIARDLIKATETFNDSSYYEAEYAVQNDYGTSNVAVITANGDAITVTSSLNNYFGSKIRSPQTGIILNDQMHDFSVPDTLNFLKLPPSPANFIEPGKRPISSMCPSIVLDANGNVVLAVGAAGGTRILTAVAEIILKYLVLHKSLSVSIREGRFHHQLTPMQVECDYRVPLDIRNYFRKIGDNVVIGTSASPFAAATGIGVRDGVPEPVYDLRRGGSATILYDRWWYF